VNGTAPIAPTVPDRDSPGAGALVLRRHGLSEYRAVWRAMISFTDERGTHSADEIWLVEHPPVYTVGLSCKDDGDVGPAGIPLVASDRGGKVTYHGPGQLVAYVLIDLRRRGVGVRTLVTRLEQAVIDLLGAHGVHGERRDGAPGVYVGGRKIAALGLRVRRGCSYHGLSLNVDMDLEPFARIDPCGYRGLEVTQMADLGLNTDIGRVGDELAERLKGGLGYNRIVASKRGLGAGG
jgi:lipoyl(octanoyl) transferase